MKKILYTFVIATLLAMMSVAAQAQRTFTGRMVGAQEVPANNSTGVGSATIVLNAAETQITVNVSFSGLSAPATAGHIHTGAPGVAGPITFPFAGVPAATSGTVPTQTFSITPAQVADLKNGNMYANIHDSNFPGGEIRAQLQSSVLISEFRFIGSSTGSGANDEFIEIYNNSDAPVTVNDPTPAASPAAQGWAVVGTNTTGVNSARFVIPNGTVIPARGHFLAVNTTATTGYSLGGYATGNTVLVPNTGATAAGFTTGFVSGGGVAIFNTNNSTNFILANRMDAVGFQGITGTTLFTEGAGLSPSGGVTANGELSFVRRSAPSTTDGSGLSGLPQDTDDNQADFLFVSTTGAANNGRTPALGAPGPENLTSPTYRSRTEVAPQLFVPTSSSSAAPNRAIVACGIQGAPACPADPNTSRGDYLAFRRSFTNNSGSTITRLRFRIIDLTTLNNTDGLSPAADLRAVTSSDTFISPTGFTNNVFGTTLEQPPTQALGGGLNSSLNVTTLPGGGLASTVGGNCPGGSTCTINVQFVFGIKAGGAFRFFVSTEATNAVVAALTDTSAETEKVNSKK
jgi:hypothetical protein